MLIVGGSLGADGSCGAAAETEDGFDRLIPASVPTVCMIGLAPFDKKDAVAGFGIDGDQDWCRGGKHVGIEPGRFEWAVANGPAVTVAVGVHGGLRLIV
ncbi:hypothetical protein GCM10025762_15310 [Haloechinothrix salitolerans]